MGTGEERGNFWESEITGIGPDEIRYRGYPVESLMGSTDYASVAYLLLCGRKPDRREQRMMDAILVSSADHGTTPPSTLATRTATSTGAPLNAAVAAGILSVNEFHGGAIEACTVFLRKVAEHERLGVGRDEAARDVLREAREQGRRVSGFGHRVHTNDPRARRLFDLAKEEGLDGSWIDRARAIENALSDATGRKVPINVDGAIAAIMLEIDLPPELGNALFMIARLPGLVAHAIEERRTQPRMRQIDPVGGRYVGPDLRSWKGIDDATERD